MPTFVHLISLTDAGLVSFTDGAEPDPVETAARFGGELLADYLTLGEFDVVAVTSFPDHESAARFALTMGSGGQTRTRTLRAFDTDEFRALLGGLDG